MDNKILKSDDICITVCGEAGQGMDTVTNILAKAFKTAEYNVFSTSEFMSRIRGGSNSNDLRVSSNRVDGNIDRIDFLIPLSNKALEHLKDRISSETIVFGETSNLDQKFVDKCKMIEVPFSDIAIEVGGIIYSNTVAAGLLMGMLNLEEELLENNIKNRFASKSAEIVNKNIDAARRGHNLAKSILENENIEVHINKNPEMKDDIIISGTEAIGMGCIAGGCNFVSSYPMSPATGVLTFLANQGKEFDIIVEQAEDEIAAINMALGASYAGARGFVSTSGGGFALMTEGVSLAGMIETPVVIHVAQRPGPATGLPTRTEQGDLELVLYAGHGYFPKIIYAPGNLEQAFDLSFKAFNAADKFQSPVFILSDQYLTDSYYNVPEINLENYTNEYHVIETDRDYKRYKLTENGISPRGIPGNGDGLVHVDSDEHDEDGCITESMQVRNNMVEKRYKKLCAICEEILPPDLYGSENYKNLIICWGSTLNIVKEAVELLGNSDTTVLHYKQVYPLHPDTLSLLQKAEKTITVENNASSQFAKLISQNTGFDIEHKILKYSGLAFTVEELVEKISEVI